MTKTRLLDDIKLDPARYYHVPTDVMRDRRFNDHERLEILEAWERDARETAVTEDEGIGSGEPSDLKTVIRARMEIQEKLGAEADIGETGKGGGRSPA